LAQIEIEKKKKKNKKKHLPELHKFSGEKQKCFKEFVTYHLRLPSHFLLQQKKL